MPRKIVKMSSNSEMIMLFPLGFNYVERREVK